MTDLLDSLRRRNPQFPDLLVKPLLSFFLAARRLGDGDLELNSVLMIIATRTIDDPAFAKLSLEDRFGGVPVFPSRGVNIRSIADSSGIPRETVRRKVLDLERFGWVVRRGSALHFTAKGFRETTVMREAMETLAVRYYEIVQAQVRGGDRAAI